jgi:hypothetical protein
MPKHFAFAFAVLTLFLTLLSKLCLASSQSPVGIGSLVSTEGGASDYEMVLESNHHFQQRPGFMDLRQYGFGQSRVELGSSIGFTASAVSGITVIGLRGHESFSPHLGIEPFNGKLSINSSDHRQGYYEWLPMVAFGPQFGAGHCRFLPLIRGGGAVGNLGRQDNLPRAHASYGAGSHLNCPMVNFATELTRISERENVDIGATDLNIRITPKTWELGMRGELLVDRASNPEIGPRIERRLMLVLRGNPFD